MLKVGRIERHMVGDPQGKNAGFTTQTREGRSSVDAQGGAEEKEEGN